VSGGSSKRAKCRGLLAANRAVATDIAWLIEARNCFYRSSSGDIATPAHMIEATRERTAMTSNQSPDPSAEAGSELRRDPRIKANRAGWIAVKKGGQLQGCFVWDESIRGAKLTVDSPAALPDTFYLYFSTRFDSRRHCRVAWRSGNQVGVEFLSASAG
jgi:hypothetical protein